MQSPEAYARQHANNWEFNGELYHYEEREELTPDWAVFILPSNDEFIDKSNNITIKKSMPESDNVKHTRIGNIEYVLIKILAGGYDPDYGYLLLTEEFYTWYDLQARLEDYASLDDMLLSKLESEATLDSIESELSSLDIENLDILLADEQLASRVFSWLGNNSDNALQESVMYGDCPNEENITLALESLGLITSYEVQHVYGDYDQYIAVENPVYPCGCRKFKPHTCTQLCGHRYGCDCWES